LPISDLPIRYGLAGRLCRLSSGSLMRGSESVRAQWVMAALVIVNKLDIAALESAYAD